MVESVTAVAITIIIVAKNFECWQEEMPHLKILGQKAMKKLRYFMKVNFKEGNLKYLNYSVVTISSNR